MVRSIVTAMLEDRGYNVVAVDGSEAAFATFSQATVPFDLVLSDLIMPGLNGRQTVERLRELGCNARCSTCPGTPTTRCAVARPMRRIALLQKPFDGEELARQVRDALDQGAAA